MYVPLLMDLSQYVIKTQKYEAGCVCALALQLPLSLSLSGGEIIRRMFIQTLHSKYDPVCACAHPSSMVTPCMMMELVILTFSLTVVELPMVERFMEVLSAT